MLACLEQLLWGLFQPYDISLNYCPYIFIDPKNTFNFTTPFHSTPLPRKWNGVVNCQHGKHGSLSPYKIEHPFMIDVMIREYTVYIYVEPNIW